jgi:hypothetical protein
VRVLFSVQLKGDLLYVTFLGKRSLFRETITFQYRFGQMIVHEIVHEIVHKIEHEIVNADGSPLGTDATSGVFFSKCIFFGTFL